jgi:hypothetical protein
MNIRHVLFSSQFRQEVRAAKSQIKILQNTAAGNDDSKSDHQENSEPKDPTFAQRLKSFL